jgi:hypothetical protein
MRCLARARAGVALEGQAARRVLPLPQQRHTLPAAWLHAGSPSFDRYGGGMQHAGSYGSDEFRGR